MCSQLINLQRTGFKLIFESNLSTGLIKDTCMLDAEQIVIQLVQKKFLNS